MKTLTFILYFVATLGLIEAQLGWRVVYQQGFSSLRAQSDFKRYVRIADRVYGDSMSCLKRHMEEKWGRSGQFWRCHHIYDGNLTNMQYEAYKSIEVRKGNRKIVCFRLSICEEMPSRC